MMLHKAFLSMVLIGMAFGQDDADEIVMNEESNEESPETIVGGSQLSQKDRAKRPFLVNVGQTNPTTSEQSFLCGGSVISPSAILTAAHCLYSQNPTPWTWNPPHWIDFFRYDTTDAIGTNGLVRIPLPTGSCVPHPDYSPWNAGNPFPHNKDVAICFLPTPAPAGATPITLNTNQNVPASTGVPLDVAGWGWRAEDNHPPDPQDWWFETTVPFVTTLNYITSLECESDPYDWRNHVTASMMCAGAVPGTSWCHGDSGGPITLGNGGSKGGIQNPVVQVGVVSHEGGFPTYNCLTQTPPLNNFPQIAARVSDVFGWIYSTVLQRTGETVLSSAGPASKAAKRLRN